MKKALYILVFSLIGAQTLLAQEIPFTTFPTHTENHNKWIIRDVNPGSSYDESITVKNLSDYTISLKLETIEFSENGEKINLREGVPPEDIGKWISFNEQKLSLQPHEKKELSLKISIPEKTALGKYQAAVMVSHSSGEEGQLNLSTRIGNRIYLNVTDSKLLQTNTVNYWNPSLQIFLILASLLGLYYGLKPEKTVKSLSQQ